ncbi:MAG TPA: phosphoribosylanthranilate isomerase [Blastocatellia bacterium]|nr:phosphoribosylanthranilate isomerase [Blastocatellia bacterium]
MAKPKLKICGITSLEDARAAIDCGAEYLGFNFYKPSPRYIAPENAREIISQLPQEIVSVGVFVNQPSPEDVIQIINTSTLQLAQLHGDESPEYCAAVGPDRVIKALRVSPDFQTESVLNYSTFAILLDAFDRKLYGGTGKTLDWNIASEVAKLTKIFLAGGLSPENVAEAINTVQPFAIDVNSGVECSPGRKDAKKLSQLQAAIVQ